MIGIDRKIANRSIAINIVKTLLFTTAITLIIFYLVLKKSDPGDLLSVFVITFITGLCSYTFAKIAVNFIRKQPTTFNYILHISLLLTGCLSGSILSYLFHCIIEDENTDHVQQTLFLYTFVFGAIFYGGLLYYFNSRKKLEDLEGRINQEKIKRLTLEKETALTTLKILQAQIEPHFLFNTLSNVVSLLDIDLKKAKNMLLDLNEYLRTSLQITRQDMTTLDQELSLIKRYLDIFKVRMGKRLTYEIEKIGDCSQVDFPPMIIQPLVENAIKYGLEPKKEGGHINVRCETNQNYLKIIVSDTGIGIGKMSDIMGIGLNNISNRLENIYGEQATLTLTDNKPSGVKAIIEVIL